VDGASSLDGLWAHGLQLFAVRRLRGAGQPVPAELLEAERAATIAALAVPAALERVLTLLPGPFVLIKGPALAAHYPDPALRPLGDLDLLVPNPTRVHQALVSAGFVVDPADTRTRPHHLPPLRWPGSPLPIELHHNVRAPTWARIPPIGEMVAVAAAGASTVHGMLTLPRAYHALVVAAHAWSHGPLVRLLDLLDVAVLVDGIDRSESAALAHSWGLNRVWAATLAAVDSILLDQRMPPWHVRLGARHLLTVSERTVFETHLARWLSCLAAPTSTTRVMAIWGGIQDELRPRPDERWRVKAARAARATRGAFRPLSEHIDDG
jgi:hypothetical protein